MSDFPVETARAQLRELISILGELRNAGPRDSRFKQWRQITLTLLQRLWPNEPSRAERFRRIPFSAPTGRSDKGATRQHFDRGWKEASTYLTGLALELGCVIEPLSDDSTADDEFPPSGEEDAVVDPPNAVMTAGEDAPAAMSWIDEVHAEDAPAPPKSESAETRKPATGPRPRLKDMLGFTDHAEPDHTPAQAPFESAPPPQAPFETAPAPQESFQAAPAPPPRPSPEAAPTARPVKFKPLTPVTARDPVAPPVQRPPAPAEPIDDDSPQTDPGDARRDLAAEFVLESAVLQSRARSTREPETLLSPTTLSPAAQDVMELAVQVEALGVPARESAIVRAALIDLARQMDTPRFHWGALRDTVGFAMNYPDLARRLMPLVMPYLDRAA